MGYMIDFKEETAVKSLIMYDYVGDCMRWNIEKWQRCLYDNFFIESFNLSYEKNEKGVMPELNLPGILTI